MKTKSLKSASPAPCARAAPDIASVPYRTAVILQGKHKDFTVLQTQPIRLLHELRMLHLVVHFTFQFATCSTHPHRGGCLGLGGLPCHRKRSGYTVGSLVPPPTRLGMRDDGLCALWLDERRSHIRVPQSMG